MAFCKSNQLKCFVLCVNTKVYVSKSKVVREVKKGLVSRKTAVFAFFRNEGKADKIHAILRGSICHLSRFVSADKAQKSAFAS